MPIPDDTFDRSATPARAARPAPVPRRPLSAPVRVPVRPLVRVGLLACAALLLAGASRPAAASVASGIGARSGPAAVVINPRPAAAVPFSGPPDPPPTAGGWRSPLPPTLLVRGFAPGPHPWSAGHRGADLRGSPGAPVLAAAGGRVTFAGLVAGVGVVSVDHGGGLTSTYEPLVPVVRRGEVVTAGQRLGGLVVAGSHCSPGACLHWGARRGGVYVDPMGLLPRLPPVLLPVPGPAFLLR